MLNLDSIVESCKGKSLAEIEQVLSYTDLSVLSEEELYLLQARLDSEV